jgi:hypothetical protein
MQIKMFPRLERYDVEFDLPEAFLPEYPPAMFLQNRPELGDVSRGEVVSTPGAAAIIRMTSRQTVASSWHSKIPRATAAPT